MSVPPPLRYLSAADVAAAMPGIDARLDLAERTLRGLAGAAELPPKIGVHPSPDGSFAHAMPAFMPGGDGPDRLGMKWVLGYSSNNALGLPAIHGTLLLNDPQTGVPTGILDAGPITAQRTAAISGVAIRAWAPAVSGRRIRAALIGAGVQGGSHVPVIGHVLAGVELAVYDPDPDRATALAATARTTTGIAAAAVAPSARDAVDGADVVVSAASFLPPGERQTIPTTGSRPMRWSSRSTTRRTAPPRSRGTRRCSSSITATSSSPTGTPASSMVTRNRRRCSARRSGPRPAVRPAASSRRISARASRTWCSAPLSSRPPRRWALESCSPGGLAGRARV